MQPITVLDDRTKVMEDGECIYNIYLDFKRHLIQSVPYECLLKKLYGYGFRKKAHEWIKNAPDGQEGRE